MSHGLFLLHKEAGMTSQRAVHAVRAVFGAAKAGHTGTLDPMATGVLPVLIGRAVKAEEFLTVGDKRYEAVMRLGLTSDTEDVFGTCTPTEAPLPSEEEVLRTVAAFVGPLRQVPPMYSAIKIGGKKLVDLAREGVVIERPARDVTVYAIEALRLSDTDYRLSVHCSKGTYIRTLCADIGRALGTGAVMAALCRTEAVGFSLSDAHTLEQLRAMRPEEREALLIPTEQLFAHHTALTLPPFFARLARAGLEIYLYKLGRTDPVGTRLRLYDERGFFALGEVRAYEDGDAVKPLKQFDLL